MKKEKQELTTDGSTLFLVIGNSGSGKDSVMKKASELCPGIHLMKRHITRKAHASEDFISVNEDEFLRLKASGFFMFDWESYSLKYGVHSGMADILENGVPVLLNISRTVVDDVKARYPGAKVVFIEADLCTIKKRLENRGRDGKDAGGISDRLERAYKNQSPAECSDVVIDNSGELMLAALDLCFFIAGSVAGLSDFGKKTRSYHN